MLEASIVLTMCIVALVIVLGLGFYLYQQSMMYTIANETAVNIAENYKYTTLDSIDQHVVPETKMSGLRKYRSYFSLTDMDKVENFVEDRVNATSFQDNSDAKVEEMKIYRDNIGRQRVKVTISMKANVVFAKALQAVGMIDDSPRMYATAYAESLDLTAYVSQVHFVNYIGNGVNNSSFGNIYNNVSDIIGDVKDIIQMIINR